MARYLKSLTTGVILPYVEAALKNADVVVCTAEEAAAYETSVGAKPSPPEPEAPVVEEVEVEEVEVKVGAVVTQDFEDGEPDADEVLEALRIE